MDTGYGVVFDRGGWWRFDHDSAINVKMFGIGSSLSSHSDNRKKYFQ